MSMEDTSYIPLSVICIEISVDLRPHEIAIPIVPHGIQLVYIIGMLHTIII